MLSRVQFSDDNAIENQNNNTIFEGSFAEKDVLLVWIDKNVSLDTADNTKIKQTLEQINNDVIYFSEVTDCVDYIKTIVAEKIFLIVAGSYAEEILRLVHHFRGVVAIFIFCMVKEKYEKLKDEYHKVIGSFNTLQNLSRSITENISLIEKHISVLELFSGIQRNIGWEWTRNSMNDFFGPYVNLAHYKELISRMKFTDDDKTEMLNFCKNYYRDNKLELKNIELFELTYDPFDAIFWYTKQCFLFKLINKTMRIDSFRALHLFRYYITDLCTSLKSHYQQFKTTDGLTPITTVYRGLKLSLLEVDILKDSIGKSIYPNGFLSTTRDRRVAEMYAGVGTTHAERDNLEIILFEIQISTNQSHTIFADVSSLSQFPDEEEVLFDIITVFRICQLDFDTNDQLWICKLLPIGDPHGFEDKYLKAAETSLILSTLSPLVINQPERYTFIDNFAMVPARLKDDHDKYDIYMEVASVFHSKHNYETAIQFYEQARDFCDTDYVKLSETLTLISFCYLDLDDFKRAIELLEKSLKNLEDNVSFECRIFSTVILLLGGAYSYVNDYNKALALYEKFVTNSDVISSKLYEDLLRQIGDVYLFQERYAMAQHYYAVSYTNACEREMNEFYSKELKHQLIKKPYKEVSKRLEGHSTNYFCSPRWPPRDSSFSGKYRLKASIIAKNKQWTDFDQPQLASNSMHSLELDSSLENYPVGITELQQTLSSYQETLPEKSQAISDILLKLAKTYESEEQFDKSIEYYRRYLDRTDHEQLQIISHMGFMYEKNNDLVHAIECYEKACEINGEEGETGVWLLRCLGSCYFYQGTDDMIAITYLKQALEKNEELKEAKRNGEYVQPYENSWVAEIHNLVAEILYKNKQDDQALEYYISALKLREISQEKYETIADAIIFYHIGEIYYRKYLYKDALRYHQRSLDVKRKVLKSADPSVTDSLEKIGLIHKSYGNTDHALGYYRNVQKLREKHDSHSDLDDAQTHHNIGNVYYRKSMFAKALEAFFLALRLREQHCDNDDPDLAWTNHRIGMVYFDINEADSALDYLERALKIRSLKWEQNKKDIARSLESIGNVYYCQKKMFDVADTYYSRALELYKEMQNGNCTTLLMSVAELNVSRTMYDTALQFFEKALSNNVEYGSDDNITKARIYSGLGNMHFKQKNNESALHYFFLSQELFSANNSPEYISDIMIIFRFIGMIFYRKNMHTESLDYFFKELALYESGDKKDVNQKVAIYQWIGDVSYRNEGLDDQALEYYLKVLQLQEIGRERIYYKVAHIYDSKDMFDEAIYYFVKWVNVLEEKMDKSLEDEDDIISIWLSIANVCMRKNDYDSALNHCFTVLRKQEKLTLSNDFDLLETYEYIANSYLKLNNLEASLEYYRKIFEILLGSPSTKFMDFDEMYQKMASVFIGTGHWRSAIAYFYTFFMDNRRNNDNDKYQADLDKNMAMIYFFNFKIDQAMEMFEKVLANTDNDPGDIVAINYLIGSMYKKLDLSSALKYFLETVNVCHMYDQPILPLYYLQLAEVYEKLKHNTNALQYYKKAKDVSDGDNHKNTLLKCLNQMARLHYDSNEYEEALENYLQSIKLSPNSTVYVSIARIYAQEKNDVVTAEEYFQLALDLCDSTNIENVFYDVLVSCNCRNIKNKCETKAFELCQTHDERVLLYNRIGCKLHTDKQYELSLHYLLKVLDSPTESVSVISDTHYRIGINYYKLNDKIRALECFKKTLTYYPTVSENIITSCVEFIDHLYQFENDYEQTIVLIIELLERPEGNIKQNALIMTHIGWLYKKSDNFAAARQYSNRALDLCMKHSPDDKKLIYNILSCIASTFYDEGKFYLALETSLNALNIIQDGLLFEENQTTFVSCLNIIACIYLKLANTSVARDYLLLAKTIEPIDDPCTASTAHNLGDTYYYEKNFDQALKQYFQAMVLYDKESLESYAYLYYDIGRVYRQQQHYEEAIEYHTKAARLIAELYPFQSIRLQQSCFFYCLGKTYHLAGRLNESLVYHTKALDIRKKLLSSSHYDVARSLHALANIINKTDSNGALDLYNHALKVYKETFYKNTTAHPVIIEVKQDITKTINQNRT